MAAPKYRRTRLVLIGAFAAAVVGGAAYFNLEGNASNTAQTAIPTTGGLTSSIQSTPVAQRQPVTNAPARRSRAS